MRTGKSNQEHAVEEVTPPLEDTIMQPRGSMGYDIIIFDNKDLTESNDPEDTDSKDGLDE